MKIKWGALVVDGRGKLGGHVASKNKSGNYLRTKVTPNNPRTEAQTAVRQMFASISSGWSALTYAQRASFNEKVDSYSTTDIFGDQKNPTGKSLYQKLNQNLAVSGQPPISVCPDPLDVPAGVLTSNVWYLGDSTGIQAVMGGNLKITGDTTGSKILIFGSGYVSAGTTFVKNKMRILTITDVANADSVAAGVETYGNEIGQAWQAKYGSTLIDSNCYVGVKFVNANGQASPMQIIKCTFEV